MRGLPRRPPSRSGELRKLYNPRMSEGLYPPRHASTLWRVLRWQPRTHEQVWMFGLAAGVFVLAILWVTQWGFGWTGKFSIGWSLTYSVGCALSQSSVLSIRLHRRRRKARDPNPA
jgi:hypothetical protein